MKYFLVLSLLLVTATFSAAAEQVTTVYDGAVLTEDATWRGSILVRGSVVVAPQTTLRIDPGTTVRFAATASQQQPTLIVHGRFQASGTAERPILLLPDRSRAIRGGWGGVVLISSEKRNILEHCRIEYAETGIDIRFSTVSLKSVSIVQARTALLSHDGNIQMSGGTVSDSDTGIEIYNSEFEGRDTTVSSCQRGALMNKSGVVLTGCKFISNIQSGFEAEECRIRIQGGEFSDNALGARIQGGEGQIAMSHFRRNRQTALHLTGTRSKIQRCLFAENLQQALQVDDGRALLLNNAFSANGGYNLYNAGREVVSARQNWWGTADHLLIRQKIHDSTRDKNVGVVNFSPWLIEKPPLMP